LVQSKERRAKRKRTKAGDECVPRRWKAVVCCSGGIGNWSLGFGVNKKKYCTHFIIAKKVAQWYGGDSRIPGKKAPLVTHPTTLFLLTHPALAIF